MYKNHLKIIILCYLSLFYFNSKAVKMVNDSITYLEINGKISKLKTNKPNTYKVELLLLNQIIDSNTVKGNNAFHFKLKKNKYYSLRISKDGYYTKLIGVDTKMGFESGNNYKFYFKTDLMEKKEAIHLNTEALDFPIAIISYHEKIGKFDVNVQYTNYIKKTIYGNFAGEIGMIK
jgi:predicted transcriptional regulator